MKRKLLVVDTETGGLDPNTNAIISIAAIVYNDGAIEDRLYEVVTEGDPEQGGGTIEDGALKVNGFTREQIVEVGKSPIQVVNVLENFLLKHNMMGRVTICAHNAAFDVGFMKRLYARGGKDFGKRFSYRHLCTQVGALLLEQAGRLTIPGGSVSLDSLVKIFGIELDRSGGHNALADAEACAMVLKKELELLR